MQKNDGSEYTYIVLSSGRVWDWWAGQMYREVDY